MSLPTLAELRPRLSAIFLDRDGVLNRKMPEGRYVERPEHFQVLPGVVEAIARLNREGLRVLVVTNQRGIALGLYTLGEVRDIHTAFQAELNLHHARIDGFYVCPHLVGQCDCRKPLTGLFKQAAAAFPEISAATSLMVGDSLVDMEFGRRLGMATVLIEGDAETASPGRAIAHDLADYRFGSLADAVGALLD